MRAAYEFANTDYAAVAAQMRGRVIIDCVGVLDGAEAARQGFNYISPGDVP